VSALLHALVRQVFPRATDEQCELLLSKVRTSGVWEAPNAYCRSDSAEAKERTRRILELHGLGWSQETIAAELGDISRHRVGQILRAAKQGGPK